MSHLPTNVLRYVAPCPVPVLLSSKKVERDYQKEYTIHKSPSMLTTNSSVANVKNNLRFMNVRSRYKRHETERTSPLESLGPKLELSQRGEQRVRLQQAKNLYRDTVLLATVVAIAIWLIDHFLF